jgi:hypothetical protein
LGPDSFEFVNQGPSNPSTGPGTPLVSIQKFKAKRGNDAVGDCWQCTSNTKIYEYTTKMNGQAPGDNPDQWVADAALDPDAQTLSGCSSADNAGFYWASPYIVDKKV